jgi:dienelactone hydrolase
MKVLRAIAVAMVSAAVLFTFGCGDDDGGGGDPASEARYADPGPYPVGFTTVDLGDRLASVWYPGEPDSEAGLPPAVYASVDPLPESLRGILPAELVFDVEMPAYDALPVSADKPFPVLTFSHGAGGFRQAYSSLLAGIASHGLVVVSLDHLEWGLLAQFGLEPTLEIEAGELVQLALAAIASAGAEAGSAIEGWADVSMVATAGHSAGGRAAFALPDDPAVRTMLSFAAGSGSRTMSEKPIFLLIGAEDGAAASLEEGYEELVGPKRFISIGKAGHNSFTDQCDQIFNGLDLIGLVREAGLPLPDNLAALAVDGCLAGNLPPTEAWRITQHFTVAHLRAVFGIDDRPVGLGSGIADAFEGVDILYRMAP